MKMVQHRDTLQARNQQLESEVGWLRSEVATLSELGDTAAELERLRAEGASQSDRCHKEAEQRPDTKHPELEWLQRRLQILLQKCATAATQRAVRDAEQQRNAEQRCDEQRRREAEIEELKAEQDEEREYGRRRGPYG